MKIDKINEICVVGWAKSGISLCALVLTKGKKVKVTESGKKSNFEFSLIDKFAKKGVEFEFGSHTFEFIKDSQLIVVSPGVDISTCEAIKNAKRLGIPCVGEIEFSSWFTKADIIAITGTNGKTTTSQLTYEVIKKSKKRVFLGGNIGTPFSSFVLDTRAGDIIVLELSSFQLETIIDFKPYVAVLLNVAPDHFDRHKDFKQYLKAKANIFKNQDKNDWAILNKNMTFLESKIQKLKSKKIYFNKEFGNENLSCVYRIAKIFGISKNTCAEYFLKFKGLEHRLEFVRTIRGVDYINDSKATNPASTVWGLKSIKKKIILIAGGRDKGLDYLPILDLSAKIKKINIFGESAVKIKKILGKRIDSQIFSSLGEAIKEAKDQAKNGDVVLFSPMCSSFDIFSDYEERGRKFKDIVKKLKI